MGRTDVDRWGKGNDGRLKANRPSTKAAELKAKYCRIPLGDPESDLEKFCQRVTKDTYTGKVCPKTAAALNALIKTLSSLREQSSYIGLKEDLENLKALLRVSPEYAEQMNRLDAGDSKETAKTAPSGGAVPAPQAEASVIPPPSGVSII